MSHFETATEWETKRLDEVAEILDSRRVPVNAKEREKRRGSVPYYGATGQVGWIDDYLFDEEVILLGEDGAPFLEPAKQKAYVVSGKSWVNNHAHVLRAQSGVPALYLKYWLDRLDYRPFVNGTTRLKLTQAEMRRIPVPLAPTRVRIEIVAEIEKQFSRLDEAVANLQRAKANLQRYKASILKAAVEGRLVETEASISQRKKCAYETARDLIGRTPVPPRPNRYGSRTGDVLLGHSALAVGTPPLPLPEGWEWVELVAIARMETGHTPSRSHPEWWGGDIPWIGIADARDHHEGTIRRTIQYTNADGIANSAARILPAGTVCVSRTASVGYVVVMAESMATSQDFVNWVPTSAVISGWLRVVFTADRDTLLRFGKGSVHKTIYFPEWLSMAIALPPLAEQHRVVGEADRRLSIVREVEAEVDANLKRAQALRQAVLAKAFSGERA